MSPPLFAPTRSPQGEAEAPRFSLASGLGLVLLALWLSAAPSQFSGLTSGDNNFWPQSLALLLLGGVALLASVAGVRVQLEPVGACLLAFSGWTFLSTLCAVYAHDAWLEMARVSGIVFVFFACRAFRHWLDWLVLASVAGATLAGAIAIVDFLSSHNTAQAGAFANQNLFAALLAPSLWLSPLVPVLVWRRTRSLALALVGLAPFVCLGLSLALTSSKGGFLSAVAAALVFGLALVRAKGGALKTFVRRAWPMLLVMLMVFGAVGAKTVGPRLLSARGSEDNSTQFRAYTWRGTLAMARARPLVGLGPGAFPTVFPRFALAGYTRAAHQSWLQIAAESGIPALLLLLGAFTFAAREAWRKLRSPQWAQGVCGLAVHGCFDSGYFTIAVGALLFVALALCVRDEDAAPATQKRGLSLPFLGATLVLLVAGYGSQKVASAEDILAQGQEQIYKGIRPTNAREAVQDDPGSARAWNFLARTTPLDNREVWESAFEKAAGLQPDSAAHPRDYAQQLASLPAPTAADLQKIGELYDRAVELDPLNSSLRLERGKWRLDAKDRRGFDDLGFVLREWDAPYGKYSALGRETNVNLDFARATLALAPRLKAQGQNARLKKLVARALEDCAAARKLQKTRADLLAATAGRIAMGNFSDLDALESGLRAIR